MSEQDQVTSQFDFWVGEWECSGPLRTTPGKDDWSNSKAKNSIKKILGGKVVEESFSMDGFNGRSVTVYDQKREIWRQTWVDDAGGYLAFEGGIVDGKMVLNEVSKPIASNPDRKQRMVFSDFLGDSFTWEWQSSQDGGKTWELDWRLNYKRKKE